MNFNRNYVNPNKGLVNYYDPRKLRSSSKSVYFSAEVVMFSLGLLFILSFVLVK